MGPSSADFAAARYGVEVLRRQQQADRAEGAAAVRLIDAAVPQMTKTADGHISVRA